MVKMLRLTKDRTSTGSKSNIVFLALVMVLFIILLSAWIYSFRDNGESKNELIREAVLSELNDHPSATLIDIYKYFFQDAYGPGHMIPSRQAALDYLQRELAASQKFEARLFQPLGYKNNYYRVNLSLVKDEIIPVDTLLNAFVTSANSVKAPEIKDWQSEWTLILQVIESMKLDLTGFDDDKYILAKMLIEGNAVVHHSKEYIRLYDPHYRIVDKESYMELEKYVSGKR